MSLGPLPKHAIKLSAYPPYQSPNHSCSAVGLWETALGKHERLYVEPYLRKWLLVHEMFKETLHKTTRKGFSSFGLGKKA